MEEGVVGEEGAPRDRAGDAGLQVYTQLHYYFSDFELMCLKTKVSPAVVIKNIK